MGTLGGGLCGGDRQIRNSKVKARIPDTDLYMFGPPEWRVLRSIWSIVCGALRLGVVCAPMFLTLVYIVQGAGAWSVTR
jgi:hypothetical protein